MNDRIKTEFQETGFCRLERGSKLDQIIDLCDSLGIEPYEVTVGYDKGSVYLMSGASAKKKPKKETKPVCEHKWKQENLRVTSYSDRSGVMHPASYAYENVCKKCGKTETRTY